MIGGRVALWAGGVLGLLACAGRDSPAAQLARGAEVYDGQCRACHDVGGGIGVPLTERVIAAYGSADRLYAYLSVAMPYGAPGSLAPRAYWDLVAYLASDRGMRALPMVLDPGTAATVRLAGNAIRLP